MIRIAAMLLLLFSIVGCVSPQQQEQQEAYAREQYMNVLHNRCVDFGYPSGTPEFRQCMMQLHQQNQANRAALGAALIGSGALNQRPPPPSASSFV